MISIPIEIINTRIILEAKANNISGKFLLDTGAQISVIGPHVFKKLNLPEMGFHTGNVAGNKTIKIPLTKLNTVAIGSFKVPLNPVAIVDTNNVLAAEGLFVDGAIGSDFLKNFIFTIDYKDKKIIFEDEASYSKKSKTGKIVPIKLVNDSILYLSTVINGHNIFDDEYKIDTGCRTTVIRLKDAHNLGIDINSRDVKEETKRSLGGDYKAHRLQLQSFGVSDDLLIRSLNVNTFETPIGFIGGDYLKNFSITFNYKDHLTIFSSFLT